jgi:hypothetical protein
MTLTRVVLSYAGIAVLMAGCGSSPSAQDGTANSEAALSGGQTYQFNQDLDVIVSVPFPCAGEDVHMTGQEHFTVHLSYDNAGGSHFELLDNVHGLTGVGVSTGETYHAHLGLKAQESDRIGKDFTFGSEITFVQDFRLIGKGAGTNILIHETAHQTFHPDGTLTSYHDKITAECE